MFVIVTQVSSKFRVYFLFDFPLVSVYFNELADDKEFIYLNNFVTDYITVFNRVQKRWYICPFPDI